MFGPQVCLSIYISIYYLTIIVYTVYLGLHVATTTTPPLPRLKCETEGISIPSRHQGHHFPPPTSHYPLPCSKHETEGLFSLIHHCDTTQGQEYTMTMWQMCHVTTDFIVRHFLLRDGMFLIAYSSFLFSFN